jgi:hypothetical protein
MLALYQTSFSTLEILLRGRISYLGRDLPTNVNRHNNKQVEAVQGSVEVELNEEFVVILPDRTSNPSRYMSAHHCV